MPLDAQMQMLVDAIKASGFPTIGSVSAAEMRAFPFDYGPVETEVQSVEDISIPCVGHDMPARIYRPQPVARGVILYIHGGGWVMGDLMLADATLRIIANNTGCTIVSLDYRLAPEHPFPAAVEDAVAGLQWAADKRQEYCGSANAPLIVMGDSAGGNLSAVIAQIARDNAGPPIALQVLIYPSTDGDARSEAMFSFVPPFLEQAEMEWYMDQYIPQEQRSDPLFAPALAADLSGLPPALIVTAEYDLLRSDGATYAQKLNQAGVQATWLDYPGAIHGFFTLAPKMDLAARAIEDVSRHITDHLNKLAPR